MPASRKLFLVALVAAVLAAGNLPRSPLTISGAGASNGKVSPAAVGLPSVGGCQVFPSNNAWNQDVSNLPLRSDSATLVRSISTTGGRTTLHADFGGHGIYGIPYQVEPGSTKREPIHYTAYGDESNPGPFPIPPTARVEGGSQSTGDRHVLVVLQSPCRLYELYNARWRGNRWDAASGASWNLESNKLRPLGWTSADAAGLPILPGLVRFNEVASGVIRHALRFTVEKTQAGYILPATHLASSSTNAALPPMGLRLRLSASYDISRFHGEALVILRALKKYGMIVADNGSSWFITGQADPRWNDDDLNQLKTVPGSAFQAVNTGPIHH